MMMMMMMTMSTAANNNSNSAAAATTPAPESSVSMVDLYPVVHDLTEFEYGGDHLDKQDETVGGYFYLRDLALPLQQPLDFHRHQSCSEPIQQPPQPMQQQQMQPMQTADTSAKKHTRRRSSFMRILRSGLEHASFDLSDTQASSFDEEAEYMVFDDKYELQREVCCIIVSLYLVPIWLAMWLSILWCSLFRLTRIIDCSFCSPILLHSILYLPAHSLACPFYYYYTDTQDRKVRGLGVYPSRN
jgi:hypothetical protein